MGRNEGTRAAGISLADTLTVSAAAVGLLLAAGAFIALCSDKYAGCLMSDDVITIHGCGFVDFFPVVFKETGTEAPLEIFGAIGIQFVHQATRVIRAVLMPKHDIFKESAIVFVI